MKKIIGVVMLLAIAAVAAFNVNFNLNESNNLSSIALANVEALAGELGDSGSTITGDCSESIVIVVDCSVTCPSCFTTWFTDPVIKKATAKNIKGKCSCGHSFN